MMTATQYKIYVEVHAFVEAALALLGKTFILEHGRIRHPSFYTHGGDLVCPIIGCAFAPGQHMNGDATRVATEELFLSADAADAIQNAADASPYDLVTTGDRTKIRKLAALGDFEAIIAREMLRLVADPADYGYAGQFPA